MSAASNPSRAAPHPPEGYACDSPSGFSDAVFAGPASFESAMSNTPQLFDEVQFCEGRSVGVPQDWLDSDTRSGTK